MAMHCCDIARAGQSLPSRLPDDWSHTNIMQRERTGSLNKPPPMLSPAFALLNHELQETFKSANNEEANETERKNSIVTYEEKRQKNYEVRHLQTKKKTKREIRRFPFSRMDTKNSNDVDKCCVNRRNGTSEIERNEVEKHRSCLIVDLCFSLSLSV